MKLQRIMFCLSGIVLASSLQPVLAGAEEDLPLPLFEAAEAYEKNGSDAFLPVLVGKSRLQYADSTSLQQASNVFRVIEQLYGEYVGIELVRSVPISASIRIVYFVLKYERGPLYGVVDVYDIKGGEIVTNSDVNTEIMRIIPAGIIAGFP